MLESTNLSHITIFPASTAGLITSSICCALDAAYKKVYVNAVISVFAESSIISLSFSPIEVPPGSLVKITSNPLFSKYILSFSICVDFPDPSIPSKDIKHPLSILLLSDSLFIFSFFSPFSLTFALWLVQRIIFSMSLFRAIFNLTFICVFFQTLFISFFHS